MVLEWEYVKLLVFCLLGRKFGQSFFVCASFVSFYQQAKSVSQQMRNCVYKTQTATTGTRPPLVASQYRIPILPKHVEQKMEFCIKYLK